MRLMSSRFVTSRLRRSASLSMDAARSRRASASSARSGSMRLPAAARIDASGVRRSCETESSRADFAASLLRAISAPVASVARRSRSNAWPTWSAAAARTRVWPRPGGPALRRRTTQIEPRAPTPAVIGIRKHGSRGSCTAAVVRRGSWTRTHPIDSSPGRRCRSSYDAAILGGSAAPLSASTRSCPTSGPSPTQARVASTSERRISTSAGSAERAFVAVTSSRPTRYCVRAWRSRRRAVSARARCIPASCPTTTPIASRRRRLSSSSAFATMRAPVGATNRKSYRRNDPIAVTTAADVPKATAIDDHREQVRGRSIRDPQRALERSHGERRAGERDRHHRGPHGQLAHGRRPGPLHGTMVVAPRRRAALRPLRSPVPRDPAR